MNPKAYGVRVSAPGKVLLTGGYLILQEAHAGLVLATSARFHTTINCATRSREDSATAPPSESAALTLLIESPQFAQTIRARVVAVEGGRFGLRLGANSDRNAYIEETLLCAINGIAGLDRDAFTSACAELAARNDLLRIRLEADNAFYSQAQRLQDAGKALSRHNLAAFAPFLPPVAQQKDSGTGGSIAKTGLGSSAALVTSLVGALMHVFVRGRSATRASDVEFVDLVHNLAQLSHCFVQRKIGSGFDVSAACYGSQRYSRFSTSILDRFTEPSNLDPTEMAKCLQDQTQWRRTDRVRPFQVPANFHLLMGDVSTGSATVSMVKQVLHWQQQRPEDAKRVIDALASNNAEVEQSFVRLQNVSKVLGPNFETKCHEMAILEPNEWRSVDAAVGSMLLDIRESYERVRRSFREMGELAGVPIEPPEQTELLDATMQVRGVLIAGVPGAGGYDALFVLVIDAAVLDRVEALWIEWAQTHPTAVVCPLLCDLSTGSLAVNGTDLQTCS